MSSAIQEQTHNYCALPLARYACRPDQTRGRVHPHEISAIRTCFQRDRDRIIHTHAFRQLKDKTQVFVVRDGHEYRTRLTHTMEVAQIARSLARALLVNEDLAEAIALAHDLGHPPFAHVGEDVLAKCMQPYGGFEHNDQSLRVITLLEDRYPEWAGLNLTWETLEGVVKHNGPVTGDAPFTLAQFSKDMDLEINTHASLEAQLAAIADDIAYNTHDVEDGLNAGMITLQELQDIPMMAQWLKTIHQEYPNLTEEKLKFSLFREMIGALVNDVIDTTRANLKAVNPQSAQDIRMAGRQMAVFSDAMRDSVDQLRQLLWTRIYKHERVLKNLYRAEKVIEGLFDAYMARPEFIPFTHLRQAQGEAERARNVADAIASMNDLNSQKEYAELTGINQKESHEPV